MLRNRLICVSEQVSESELSYDISRVYIDYR